MLKLKFLVARAVTAAFVSMPVVAAASQGPGGGPGTAGHLTQLTMAIVVYGGCALIVAAGLVGGLRSQGRPSSDA